MTPRIRDVLLLVASFCLVTVSVAGLIYLIKVRDLSQRAVDEARQANIVANRVASKVSDIAEDVHPKAVSDGLKQFHYECYTSMSEATCQLTNFGAAPARACIRGIVTRKNSSNTAESIVVCTGEVRHKESKTLQAMFTVGAIKTLCPGDYGGVNWDNCSFQVIDMTGAGNKLAAGEL